MTVENIPEIISFYRLKIIIFCSVFFILSWSFIHYESSVQMFFVNFEKNSKKAAIYSFNNKIIITIVRILWNKNKNFSHVQLLFLTSNCEKYGHTRRGYYYYRYRRIKTSYIPVIPFHQTKKNMEMFKC